MIFSNPKAYERYMGPWSSRLASKFIEFADVRDSDRVLDVGCGTGVLTLAIAEVYPRSEVIAVDPSKPYLEFARGRARNHRAHFHVGSALTLPYSDGCFDKTVAQLAVSFFPDAHRAVAEMCRVTRPGGSVAACVWASDQSNQRNRLFWEAAVRIDSDLKQQRQARKKYGEKDRLYSLWTACGLKAVEEAGLTVSVEFATFDDYWTPYLNGQGHAVSYVKSLTKKRRNKLKEHLRQVVLETQPKEPFSIGARALAVRGLCRSSI